MQNVLVSFDTSQSSVFANQSSSPATLDRQQRKHRHRTNSQRLRHERSRPRWRRYWLTEIGRQQVEVERVDEAVVIEITVRPSKSLGDDFVEVLTEHREVTGGN